MKKLLGSLILLLTKGVRMIWVLVLLLILLISALGTSILCAIESVKHYQEIEDMLDEVCKRKK